MRIYIVEDDTDIRDMEAYALKNSGYDVAAFSCAQELYDACKEGLPDLLILDIMLPEEDGLSVLSRFRQNEKAAAVPVMMVTAKGSELDRVKGLDAGADDYLVKPFGIMEMISRVKALLRRTAAVRQNGPLLKAGDLLLDDDAHTVTVAGTPCLLTYKEYELLKLLMSCQNRVLTREVILNRIWGYDFGGETRTVDMHIKTLRRKLGEAGNRIETVRGVGYKFAAN
ncbi:MAG: response regulator transcription factor [Acutalibacteraceae bacterium]